MGIPVQPGAFSIRLAVRDLAKPRELYEKLGFEIFAGNPVRIDRLV